MSFRNFGYPFSLSSPASVPEVKAAIRRRKMGWFNQTSGTRGGIVGPFLYLRWEALGQSSPTLFGVIRSENGGTNIKGRTSPPLAALLYLVLFAPIGISLIYGAFTVGTGTGKTILIALAALLGGPALLFLTRRPWHEGEPLVRFLRQTVTASGASLRKISAKTVIPKSHTVTVNGAKLRRGVTLEAVYDALVDLGDWASVILGLDGETYMRTASLEGGYVIEKREGGSNKHFRAFRLGGSPQWDDGTIFDFEETLAVFSSYASKSEMPPFLEWRRISDNAKVKLG